MDSTTVLKEMGTEEKHIDSEKRKNYFLALRATLNLES
jgi:hypothetical protein